MPEEEKKFLDQDSLEAIRDWANGKFAELQSLAANYDAASTYSVGDLVVHEGILYKAKADATGEWDSSKWDEVTLDSLMDEVKEELETKANVDGNYPTMTVGVADQLSPYDESAGDDQDEPFSFQATGTGNGTQPDFSTGSGALIKEKQGNTVVVNQIAKALNSTNWTVYNASASYSDGVVTLTATDDNQTIPYSQSQNVGVGHKVLAIINFVSTTSASATFRVRYPFVSDWLAVTNGIKFALGTSVEEESNSIGIQLGYMQNGENVVIKSIYYVDLTQWFNGDIPQDLLDNPSNFFRYYQGSLAYNEGTLVNANGRYIKCIGMNQWDEEWETGKYNTNTGVYTQDDTRICSKHDKPIKAIPNTTYYVKTSGANWLGLLEYDINDNFVKYNYLGSSGTITTQTNTAYFRFMLPDTYGTVYNNDISINLYYEDEPRCLTYEPYQVLTNNDTGTEVLRSAGSVKDYKTPDGTITRKVGYVDLGSLTWNSHSNNRFEAILPSLSKSITDTTVANIVCKLYERDTYSSLINNHINKTMAIYTDGAYLEIINTDYNDPAAFKTAMSGVYLFYELAEPTTEQGTPYSENLVIDDFGSMDFGSDVPQGCLIFYPVDYKAFIDTLYKYTDGAPSNIALKSDLSASETQRDTVDAQLKNALGGTLRQLLAISESIDFLNTDVIDLGELNWTYQGNDLFNSTSTINGAGVSGTDKSNTLCSLYKNDTANNVVNHVNDKTIVLYSNKYVYIVDSAYADATAFKNAMKGVLLAYEKASE